MKDFLCCPDSIGQTGMDDVIRINEKDHIIRVDLRIFFEGFKFVIKVHHPAVGHGTAYGNTKFLACKDGCGPIGPTNISGTGSIDSCIHVVGPACTKVRYNAALGRADNPVRLCRNEGLMIDFRKDSGFKQLGIEHGRGNRQDGFMGIHDGSFGQGIDIAMEMIAFKIGQEFFAKQMEAAEISYVTL